MTGQSLISKLYYGHFMCHVLHQDYIVKKGVDIKAFKVEMLEILDGAERNILPSIMWVISIQARSGRLLQGLRPDK